MPQHTCAKGGSEQMHRNGHSSEHARYRCNGCGHQARFVPSRPSAQPVSYGQVAKLLAERHSPRSIVRVAGILGSHQKLSDRHAEPVEA